ncbi:MAG TPA: ABC transporter transmembrane domain-containing protein [Halalkalibaculum sp.]|nr:ABC transporter transmembrane domain-containing protein [Halalkalibaculum sp.]
MDKNNESTQPAKSDAKTLWLAIRRIFRLSKPYRVKFYVATVLAVASSAVGLSVPLGLKALIDSVFQSADAELLNIIALVLFGLFVAQAFLSFGSTYWLEWVGERVVTDLRKSLYEHLHRLGFRYFSDKRLGEITSRLTNDVGSVRTALTNALPQTITVTFSLLGSIALMIMLNWRLSLIVFLTVPVVTLLTRYFGGKIRKLSRDIQDDLADSTAVAEDALGAIRIVKAFAREVYEVGRYSESVENLFRTSRKKILLTSLFWSGISVMFMTTLVIIFWFGGLEVLAGRLTTGDLVAFIFYAFAISRSISQMSRLYTDINTAVGASDRIFELLDEVPEIEDAVDAVSLEKIDGKVTFEEVRFAYEKGRSVLKDINLEIKAGETIAVVGPSGAGKTTLINLIPRFFDPQRGRILIDGIDIRNIQKKSLREQIAIVPQDVHLFGTSIKENIRYGRLDATSEDIAQAAADANALEFIQQIPEGLDAKVGEKGVKLSGGQRQRLAIARALLKDPGILLLDEATSSLDSESEAQVQEALERLMKNRTTFIIAHRLSTVQHADRIVVIEQGEIVQKGTHDELLAKGGLYKKLYDMQLREDVEA